LIKKELGTACNIPWYELDNVVHIRLPSGVTRRSPEERDYQFNRIMNCDNWIIEGVYREFFYGGFDKADTIIFLDIPPYILKYRIAKRWLRQRLKLEKANYVPTLKMLLHMYKWSSEFEKSKDNILRILEPCKNKVIVLNNSEIYLLNENNY